MDYLCVVGLPKKETKRALTLVVRPLTYLARRCERNSENRGLKKIIDAPNRLLI